MLLPDQLVLYMAVAGATLLILGVKKSGVGLLMPACIRWVVLPLVIPNLQQIPIIAYALALPLVAIFGGLFLLDRGVSFVYGRRAGGHVTGTYLVRIFDAAGRAVLWVAHLPFRIVARIWLQRPS